MKTVIDHLEDSPQEPKRGQDIRQRTESLTRAAYMRSKGLPPGAQHQLDLVFPDLLRADLRHIPNDLARSSIFTVKNRKTPRKNYVHEILFHYNEHIEILYTGSELRAEDDELVWLQILAYGSAVPLGTPFQFKIRDLVRDVGWSTNGRNYTRVRKCISRLKATEIMANNNKAYGTSGAISLIQNYTAKNDGNGQPCDYEVWIDKAMIVLFAGNTFTSHRWQRYRDLSPVARRLTDYIESHKQPYPLALNKFKGMCGSVDTNATSWRQTVREACEEVRRTKIVETAFVDAKDLIVFSEALPVNLG